MCRGSAPAGAASLAAPAVPDVPHERPVGGFPRRRVPYSSGHSAGRRSAIHRRTPHKVVACAPGYRQAAPKIAAIGNTPRACLKNDNPSEGQQIDLMAVGRIFEIIEIDRFVVVVLGGC
jgi:hypothetical protein